MNNKLYKDIVHPFYGKFRVITKDLGISQWIIKNYIWEEHILKMICKYIKPNSVIIDIGANIGTHTVGIIQDLFKYNNHLDTKIVAFEPQPFIFSILEKNIENKFELISKKNISIDLHSCGLSDSSNTIYMKMPDYSVVENPGGYGIDFNICEDKLKTKIDIKTLDSFNYNNVSFIKIDVEGHENQVLKGSEKTILKCKPIMIIEILGGVLLDKASISQMKYINNTKDYIKSLNYTVELINCCDYLCLPITP